MLDFSDRYGFIIRIVFVVSVCILVVNLIYQFDKSITNAKVKRKFYANAEKKLQRLNNYQKTIIYELYLEDNRTLPLYDMAVLELGQSYMIDKASSQYMISDLKNPLFPNLLQPWASDELNNKSNLLSEFIDAAELQCEKESK